MSATFDLKTLLQHLQFEPRRTGSIAITVYGDAITPRGGSLWLGSLLEIFRALSIPDGVLRTAMSRLAADGWLERRRVGRNSYYSLTEKGRRTFAAATARIYAGEPRQWDGRLTIAFLDSGEERPAVRSELESAGFALLAPGTMIAAGSPVAPSNGTIFLGATPTDPADARRLAARAWPLAEIATRYREFIETFTPLAGIGEQLRNDSLAALIVRVLLIHQYRRVILRDPLLPTALLPDDWPGFAARRLCATIYREVVGPSEAWLDAHGRTEDGPLPPPDAAFRARFSDLA
jgi:phenylacetic acid degradation operon negative regulatory protein